jgi:hypothetical protein
MFGLLGVDSSFVPPNIENRYMAAGVPRSARVDDFLRRDSGLRSLLRAVLPRPLARAAWRLADRNNHEQPRLDPALRRQLLESCREDIEKLAGLLDRDLSHWLA